MSILAYTGLPGSGKSYAVVEHQILPALRAGRVVVTNVPLHLDRLAALIPTGDLIEFPGHLVKGEPDRISEYVIPGCLFVLDEVWQMFPAGMKADRVPHAYKQLLAEHRHMVNDKGDSTQIVLVTQDLAQISAFARQLVETTFRSVKLTTVGAANRFRVDVYNGPVTGPNPSVQNRIREIYGQYRPEVFDLYKSHTMSDFAQAGANEAPVDKRANIWKRPAFIMGIVAVPLLLVGGIMGVKHFMKDMGTTGMRTAGKVDDGKPPGRLERRGIEERDRGVDLPALVQARPEAVTDKWRVAGSLTRFGPNGEPLRTAILTDNSRVVVIDFSTSCDDASGIVECAFRGGIVSELTGPAPTAASAVGAAAAAAPDPAVENLEQAGKPASMDPAGG